VTPLVLIPGLMCDARLFGPQIDALSGGVPLHLAVMTGANTVTDIAQNILKTAPPKFALAGLSMGGIVAMEMLRLAPDRVDRIALMDTNPLPESDAVKTRRHPQIAKARAGHLDQVMRDEMKPNYLVDTPNRAALLDLCMEMARGLGPDVFVQQSQSLMSRPDQTETLRGSRLPALILCGQGDILCPVSRHEFMHTLMPHATLRIIENAGHLPTLEQPGATTLALREWLLT
jgi:pimeloyl-ACP methyl ester carboxylesterase